MTSNEISVISVEVMDEYEETKDNLKKESTLSTITIIRTISILFFGIILICVLFIIPWTTIPRTDSILYQSHWMEVLLPMASSLSVHAGVRFLCLKTWTKEETLVSFSNYFKIYFMQMISFTFFYILFSLLWKLYFLLPHPFPNLGTVVSTLGNFIGAVGLWFILPSNHLAKQEFRQKLKIYMLIALWNQMTVIGREVLTYLFDHPPFEIQFVIPWMVAGAREIDKRLHSKAVTKMMGVQDEPASALIAIYISTIYSTFIAIRLVGAQFSTICCTIAIDLVLHSKMTYQIIKECRKINDTEIEIVNVEDNERITILVIAELVEGFTPVIYAMTITMAYYGPNTHLISDVGNTYWGEEIENIENLYIMMLLLFGIDTMSAIINSVCLWRLLYVDMLSEFCRVLKKYGFGIAIFLATSASLFLATKDINLGIDGSRSFKWISKDGWRNLVNDSRYLTNDEKYELLNKANLL